MADEDPDKPEVDAKTFASELDHNQNDYIKRRYRRAQWASAHGFAGGLVSQLRHRAGRSRLTARWMLFGLIAIGLFGVGSIILDAFGAFQSNRLSAASDALRQRAAEQLADIEADLTKLDRDRAAIQTEAATLLADAFVKQDVEGLDGQALYDLEIAASGEAIAVGSQGTIVVRDNIGSPWRKVTVPGLDALLIDASIASDGGVVAVGLNGAIATRDGGQWQYVQVPDVQTFLRRAHIASGGAAIAVGDAGTILVRDSSSEDWRKADVRAAERDFNALVVGSYGEAIAVGDAGQIVQRTSSEAKWQNVSLPEITTELGYVGLNADGNAVAVGQGGAIVTRNSREGPWRLAKVAGVEEDLHDLRLADRGEAIVVGKKGTILARKDAISAFEKKTVQSLAADLLDVALSTDGSAVAVGYASTIIQRSTRDADWQLIRIPGTRYRLFDVTISEQGQAIAVGRGRQTSEFRAAGVIVARDSIDGDWRVLAVPGVPAVQFNQIVRSLFGPTGKAIVVGAEGYIAERSDAYAQAINATQDDRALRDAIDAIPSFPEKQGFLDRLQEVIDQRTDLLTRQSVTAKELEAAASGELTRQQELDLMNRFLAQCSGELVNGTDGAGTDVKDSPTTAARGHEIVNACTEAYKATFEEDPSVFYRYMAERLTPAALLLFLLVTLGASYRYNVRMGALYDARADALELTGLQIDPDRYDAMATAMAAERLEFRSQKTPIDAVTDLAKDMAKKISP